MFLSVRATGIEPGDPADPFGPDSPLVTLSVAVEGDVVGQIAGQPRLFDDGAEELLIGEQVVLEVEDPPSLDGVEATAEATVTDKCDQGGTDARPVTLTLASG